VDDGAVGALDALPAVVAVHGVVAACKGGDAPNSDLAGFLLQLLDVFDAAMRRRVAPIREAVDENTLDVLLAGHPQQSIEMLHVRVYAAIAQEAEQVQIARAAALHGLDEQRLLEKFAVRNHHVDACDVHVDDSPGTHVHVAHFAVAHLPFGQTDGWAGRLDQRVGKILQQAVVVRFAREGDGVALGFGAVAPAIEDGQHNRFRSFWHS